MMKIANPARRTLNDLRTLLQVSEKLTSLWAVEKADRALHEGVIARIFDALKSLESLAYYQEKELDLWSRKLSEATSELCTASTRIEELEASNQTLERKIHALEVNLGHLPCGQASTVSVRFLAKEDEKIRGIKAWRDATKKGLRESKEDVEAMLSGAALTATLGPAELFALSCDSRFDIKRG